MARSVTGAPIGYLDITNMHARPASSKITLFRNKKLIMVWSRFWNICSSTWSLIYLHHFGPKEFGQSFCGADTRALLSPIVVQFAAHTAVLRDQVEQLGIGHFCALNKLLSDFLKLTLGSFPMKNILETNKLFNEKSRNLS